MLVSIVAVILAAAAFALVGYPLLRERREEAPELAMPDEYQLALEDLTAQRDATYSAIKELDFDQEMGNLPAGDYRELRDRYRLKAATILRDLDELREVEPAAARPQTAHYGYREPEIYSEDDIEREILRRRRGRSQTEGPRQGIEDPRQKTEGSRQKIADHTQSTTHSQGIPGAGRRVARSHRACRACGARFGPQDNFCPECGTAFSTGCPSCGAPFRPEDRFCARCGGALEEVAVR